MAEQEALDPMHAPWDQHPLPWQAVDNWPDREGDVIVVDATGAPVLFTGDMEDCSMGDIQLADLIAAAPDLAAVARGFLAWYHAPSGDALGELVGSAEDALKKLAQSQAGGS